MCVLILSYCSSREINFHQLPGHAPRQHARHMTNYTMSLREVNSNYDLPRAISLQKECTCVCKFNSIPCVGVGGVEVCSSLLK